MSEFYKIFVHLCQTRNIAPSTAAEIIGFSRSQVSRWKNTSYYPSFEVLLKISQYFNVSLDYLCTGKEKAPEEFSEEEKEIITAYRNNPEMQKAVRTLLGIPEREQAPDFIPMPDFATSKQ